MVFDPKIIYCTTAQPDYPANSGTQPTKTRLFAACRLIGLEETRRNTGKSQFYQFIGNTGDAGTPSVFTRK